MSKTLYKNELKKLQEEQINFAMRGYIPPQNIEAEEAVLGALLSINGCWEQVSDILTEDCFCREAHRIIFSAIKTIYEREAKCDIILATKELRSIGKLDAIGGSYYLSKLTDRMLSVGNIQLHAALIRECFSKRQLIEIGYEITKKGYSEDCDIESVISETCNKLPSLLPLNDLDKIKTIQDGLKEVYKTAIQNKKNVKRPGFKTGFAYYDNRTGGFQKSDLVIIAGEPSMGKTSLALNIARNIANETPIAIYSLEMSTLQLCSRFTAMESTVSSSSIMYSKLSDRELELLGNGIGKIEKLPIYLDDKSNSNIESIVSSIRFMVLKFNVEVVFIDYLGLMSSKAKYDGKEQLIGDMAKKLKNLAKELDICVVLLSQLNRVSGNGSNYPKMSRLRDSGQIEQHADVVIFPYRPSYYSKTEKYPEPHEDCSTENTALIDVAKGRNIGVFKFLVGFLPETTKFKDFLENEIPFAPVVTEEEPF